MSENERGASENEQDDDFAALFAASVQTRRFENGQAIEGSIVAIGAEFAFVNVGAKGEATIAIDELKNDDGIVDAKVGDRIQATVVSTMGGLTLSRKLQRGAATARQVEDAFRAGLPVEGKIDAQVKGGYTVTINKLRAFCPASQIDTVRDADPAVHLGRVYTFRIIEFKDDGHKFVVSRRALLQEEQKAVAEEVRKTIAVDAVVRGRVVSVRDFGAFIDLGGGVQGLLHVSEMGWSRIDDASKVVTPGEEITVKVLRIESREGSKDGEDKIALGLKQLGDDPWSTVSSTYAIGQVLPGRVTRVAEFGAFVALADGIEALAHASTFAPTGRPGGWAKTIAVGTEASFEILNIDLDKKRIGVAIVEEGSAKISDGADASSSASASGTASAARSPRVAASRSAIVPGARLTGKVERHEKFGVFVFLAPGIVGLLPLSETGIPRETDIHKALPVGSNIDVLILEVDAAGRRIRLSVKAIADQQEAAEVRDYAQRENAAQAQSFGSLADKLRGALGKK